MLSAAHQSDDDCSVAADGCCIGCGASHATQCADCGGRGYHRDGCAEIEPSDADLAADHLAQWSALARQGIRYPSAAAPAGTLTATPLAAERIVSAAYVAADVNPSNDSLTYLARILARAESMVRAGEIS